MMKWLSKFWKMRRQYGSVKVAILLFLFAGYFIIQSILAVTEYARFMGQNIEYQIAVYTPEGVQKSDFKKLEQVENFLCMTPQKVSTIIFQTPAGEKMIPVTEMYADYMQQVYNIQTSSSQASYYLNESAWKEVVYDETKNSVRMDYSREDMTAGNAQFTLSLGLRNDMPMAYTSGNSVSLEGCTSIRLMCSKNDITGSTLEKIQRLGYAVENEQEIREGMHALEIVMLKIKYGMMVVILAISLGWVLMKEAYRQEALKKK